MLRTYLGEGEEFRLNVWDKNLQVENVSVIHNHPWDFYSLVISGEIRNVVYYEPLHHDPLAEQYNYQRLKTGEGGGPVDNLPSSQITLGKQPALVLQAGDSYKMMRHTLHETLYSDGAVTLNQRTPKDERSLAEVAWPLGTLWVSAEPRPALREEVLNTCLKALSSWS